MRRAAIHTRLAVEPLEARQVPAFLAPEVYPDSGGTPAVGDFNNDGVADLVARSRSGGVGLFLGNGDGSFQAAAADAGAVPRSVAVGDFDRDGNLDVVTVNFFNLSVLLGNGDGTFQLRDIAEGVAPAVVAAGDFNGDGHADLVTRAPNGDALGVHLNNGDGTFQDARDFDAGPSPGAAVVGDFDGDGRPDPAVAAADGLAVLLDDGAW